MKLNYPFTKPFRFFSILFMATIFSCQPDEYGDGNGLTSTENLDADFTITAIEGENNTYKFSATNENYLTSHWDVNDGTGFNIGRNTMVDFYPDAGSYTIHHKVTGAGGIYKISTQNLEIETSDPFAGNIVKGGKFETNADVSEWTVLNISPSGTEWTFDNGKATVQGGGWNQKGIYQAIDVIEGLTYKVDMLVSSTSGVQNTWFEVFASSTPPVDGSDYSAGGAIAKFSTWGDCGIEPFSWLLTVGGCDFTGEQGKFIAEATETIYLVIKCGGEDLKNGVSVDNIEMRGSSE